MKLGTLLFAGWVVIASGMPAARADVPIALVPGGRQIVLDFDWDTRNHFAAVKFGDRSAGLYLSTDNGSSWTVGDSFSSSADIDDIDMVVAGDYAYLGVAQGISASLRRYSVTTGAFDPGYGVQIIVNVSPSTVVEIALASDQDGPDNEIYLALITSDGSLRFFFDSSADGTTFAELSPGISDAVSGLDMTYNPGSPDHLILFSYWDASSRLNVWRTFPWVGALSLFFSQPIITSSAISAYDDAVIVCLEQEIPDGIRALAFRSYSAGDDWDLDVVDAPSQGEGDYIGCDVTARGGGEFAATYMHEFGAFDPVYLRRHTRGVSGPWEERVVINETDVAMASIFRTSLTWFPPGHYGIAYLEDSQGYPYFDRFALLFFADGFESGDTSAWSNSVP